MVVPARGRTLAKAPQLAADEFVVDLEDAIPFSDKDRARDQLVVSLRQAAWPKLSVTIRVNPIRTQWCHQDLIAAVESAGGAVRGVVIPKVASAADLAFVDRLLDGLELACGRRERLEIQALVETAEGIERVPEIARGSPRLRAVILGYEDLAASLGRRGRVEVSSWQWAQDQVLSAARAAGIHAIDGPYLGLAADRQFAMSVERGRGLGFDGKWVIHPTQLRKVETAFSPTEQELTRARRVVEALTEAAVDGRGAVSLDGEMIDAATGRAAARLLAGAG